MTLFEFFAYFVGFILVCVMIYGMICDVVNSTIDRD